MYEIIFYEDKQCPSDVAEYILELRKKSLSNKSARINFNKTVAYFDLLQELGTRVGEPVTKFLEGDIWELRPLKTRYLYAYCEKNKFIILNYFIKKTRKTPKKELEMAKRRLKEYKERRSD